MLLQSKKLKKFFLKQKTVSNYGRFKQIDKSHV